MGELPVGWMKVEIGSLASVIAGGTPKAGDKTNFEEPQQGVAWLTPADLSGYKHMYISNGKRDLSQKGLNSSSAKLIPEGSVLFSSRAPIGYVVIAKNEIATNQGFKNFVFTKDVDSSYAYYYLKSIKSLAESKGTGTTFKELSGAVAKKLPFILPPLNEQIRIANKLDSLLAKVEAAQTRLDKIPTLLKRFRQSVLAAATSGELTKEWRSGQGDSWNEIKVGDIVKKIEAGKNIKCDERPPQEDEFGIIKISAVTWGVYNESKSKTLFDTTKFIENRRIQVGDFLISRANTLELLGMPVIVQKVSKNLMLSDKVLRLVVNEAIDKKWLNFFLRSQRGRREIESRATGNQQSMRNIGQKALLDIDLPYPEREEQKQIVHQVESLFTLADKVEKQYQQARLRTDKLSQSLLAKAFKGELVPQDPNDEPAEKLLARILEERETLKPAKKSRKAK